MLHLLACCRDITHLSDKEAGFNFSGTGFWFARFNEAGEFCTRFGSVLE